ncbi:MAG: PD-(D/E)XK nuclease domain-containing protein, partial [Succinivibrio sp.]|nr:PD-(D/E)XK nuclease domain-containing protein [Succinivibrio sp.]
LDEHSSFDIMLGMMLHTGYLTAVNVIDNKEVEVKIPNKEALGCFEKKARFLFGKENPQWLSAAYSLKDALFMGDTAQVQSVINTLLINFVSVRDYGYESFYHGFLLGVLSITADSSLHLASNQESGKGFSDITLSHKLNKRAVIIELKKMSPDDEADTLCAAALKQIEECRYAYPFEQKGYEIFKYGIAFLGKECLVAKA